MEQPPVTHTRPLPDGSVIIEWFAGKIEGEVHREPLGELHVWFQREAEDDPRSMPVRIDSVRVTLSDGITPTSLQRMPWRRWLTVADATAQAFSQPDWDVANRVMDKAWDHAWGDLDPLRKGRRPGRKGHPDSFYRKVAESYLTLRAHGISNPDKRIADELHYDRSTVAGWVRVCRARGYLPPARRGRPG